MKIFKIFLASSIVEFNKERSEISAFIGSINNICSSLNIYIKLDKSSDFNKAIQSGRKQEEYNQKIKDANMVVFLLGKRIGKITYEEMNIANDNFNLYNTPQMMFFIKEMDISKREKSMQIILNENSIYAKDNNIIEFLDLWDVKIAIIKQIEMLIHKPLFKIKITDNGLLLNNKPVSNR